MGRKSDAKERLLDAALDLIWERSYGVVTIDAICEKAGVKKGSFYYFFESKSALAVAALEADAPSEEFLEACSTASFGDFKVKPEGSECIKEDRHPGCRLAVFQLRNGRLPDIHPRCEV